MFVELENSAPLVWKGEGGGRGASGETGGGETGGGEIGGGKDRRREKQGGQITHWKAKGKTARHPPYSASSACLMWNERHKSISEKTKRNREQKQKSQMSSKKN